MINNKECKKRFVKITKGTENQGYTDWKKWIYQEVEDYNEEKMENLIKRYEIRLKSVSEDDAFRFFSIITQIVTILAAMFPFVTNVILTSLSTNISVYNFDNNIELMQKFTHIVNDTMQEIGNLLITWGTIYFIILCIAVLVAKQIDAWHFNRRVKNKIFYEELLLVLKEKVELEKDNRGTSYNVNIKRIDD